MQQNIGSFLRRSNSGGDVTPSKGSASSKSKRPRSSPEKLDFSRDKRPNMGNADLLQSISKMMDEKLERLPTRSDFDLLRADLQGLRDENKQLREEVSSLRIIGQRQEQRIEYLELQQRHGNLIFKGLKVNDGDDLFQIAGSFVREVLGLADIALSDVRKIGARGRQALLLVTLQNSRDKWAIINRTSRLKGTDYFISQDFPQQVRLRRNKLLRIRAELRKVERELVCKVRSDKLVVKDVVYSWDDSAGLVTFGGSGDASVVSSVNGIQLSSVIAELRGEMAPERRPRGGVP